MKANELMIGDWVYSTFSKLPCKVTYLKLHESGYASIETTNVVGVKDIVSLSPIPLTPEILEKNGFEKVLDEDGTECYRYYNRAADGYIKISLYNGGDGDWRIEIVNYEKFDNNKIVYRDNFIFLKVHQLQHALILCGIDKTIEL